MLRLALAAGMVLLFVSVITQVVGRYVFSYTPPWSEVTAALTLTWLTFLGAALAIRSDENLAVSLLPDQLQGIAKMLVTVLIALCGGVFAWVLLTAGYDQMAIVQRSRIIGLNLTAWWLYASAPVAAVFMLLFHFESALCAFTGRTGEPE